MIRIVEIAFRRVSGLFRADTVVTVPPCMPTAFARLNIPKVISYYCFPIRKALTCVDCDECSNRSPYH